MDPDQRDAFYRAIFFGGFYVAIGLILGFAGYGIYKFFWG